MIVRMAGMLTSASANSGKAAGEPVNAATSVSYTHLDVYKRQDVHHATLGILGMGRIGQAVARRAAGFEMRVIYHNRNPLAAADEKACNASWVSKETLLQEADFRVLLLPYSPATHHVIGAKELAAMLSLIHIWP